MNQEVDCTHAVAALLGVIEKGGSMSDETREHLRTCERCRELLDSAREFQTALSEETPAPEVHPDAAALEREVADTRRRRIVGRTLVSILAIGLFAFFLLVVTSDGLATGEAIGIVLVGTCVAILVAAPILLLLQAASGVAKKDGRRVFRRLGPGRKLSGVCAGLAEAYGVRADVLRLLFVVALFFDGFGLLAYLIFVLAMPVHPNDRQYMLRFRLRRAFGGNR